MRSSNRLTVLKLVSMTDDHQDMTNDDYEALTTGPLHSFRGVSHERLRLAWVDVYTIWRGTEFVYVGIAGRNLAEDSARLDLIGPALLNQLEC
jgi:hypothetical protein